MMVTNVLIPTSTQASEATSSHTAIRLHSKHMSYVLGYKRNVSEIFSDTGMAEEHSTFAPQEN